MLKYILLSLTLSLAISRLILPSHIPGLIEIQEKLMNPELKTQDSPSNSNSSADPVQGVANATSGYLSVNDPNTNSKLFYVFYQSRGLAPGQDPAQVPIIIWLQGGPGGSSQTGNFFEMGPYSLNPDESGKIKETPRDKSWNDFYHLLIVDNPRGTGYSIADQGSYVTTEDEVAQDFLNALVNLYELEPFQAFNKTPLYIFGESYAGHYIPSIAKKVLEHNLQPQAGQVPLAGIGIGDGFTDPSHQLAENGLFGFALGLLDDVQRAEVELYQLNGVSHILTGDYLSAQR